MVPGGDAGPALAAAERVLRAGGTVVLPTDTVYGLAALAGRPEAVERLSELKGRPADMPIAVLVADVEAALELVAPPPEWVVALMDAHWPGPLTIVLPARDGEATVGVRCPADDLVVELACRVGPLATTSANRHGEPTPAAAEEAAAGLTGDVDLLVDGGPRGEVASTVLDCTVDPPEVLREGSLPVDRLGLAGRSRVRARRPGG